MPSTMTLVSSAHWLKQRCFHMIWCVDRHHPHVGHRGAQQWSTPSPHRHDHHHSDLSEASAASDQISDIVACIGFKSTLAQSRS